MYLFEDIYLICLPDIALGILEDDIRPFSMFDNVNRWNRGKTHNHFPLGNVLGNPQRCFPWSSLLFHFSYQFLCVMFKKWLASWVNLTFGFTIDYRASRYFENGLLLRQTNEVNVRLLWINPTQYNAKFCFYENII